MFKFQFLGAAFLLILSFCVGWKIAILWPGSSSFSNINKGEYSNNMILYSQIFNYEITMTSSEFYKGFVGWLFFADENRSSLRVLDLNQAFEILSVGGSLFID